MSVVDEAAQSKYLCKTICKENMIPSEQIIFDAISLTIYALLDETYYNVVLYHGEKKGKITLSIQEEQSLCKQTANVQVVEQFAEFQGDNEDEILIGMSFDSAKQMNGTISFIKKKEELTVKYNPTIFSEGAIEYLIQTYHFWVEQLKENGTITVKDARQRFNAEIMAHKNNAKNEKDISSSETIVELIEDSIRKYPDNVALEDEQTALTYQQFNRHVNGLCKKLSEEGVQPGMVVGLHVTQSVETAIYMTAIMKLGAAFLPFNETIPESRKDHMIETAKVSIIIDQDKKDCMGITPIYYSYQELASEIEFASLQKEDSPCYVLFTSGTSGKPKGVCIYQNQMRNLLYWYKDLNRLSEDSKQTALHSFLFDTSLKNLYTPLIVGGTAVICPAISYNLPVINEFIGTHKVTHIKSNAAILDAILSEDEKNNFENYKQLRCLCLGGDQLVGTHLKDLYEKTNKELMIFNMYGTTETTDVSSAHELSELEIETNDRRQIPVGIPVYNHVIYILSSNGFICEKGMIGQIVIGGIGVCKNVITSSGNSQDYFVHIDESQENYYRTGDFGYWNEGDELVFSSRSLDYLKINGFRVNLSEIEQVADKLDCIDSCKCICWNNMIALFYIAKQSEDGKTRLEKVFQKTLPAYMIPKHYVSVETFPLTSNGKVDQQALIQLLTEKNEPKEEDVPVDDVSNKILAIWMQVLKRDEISIHDNFFAAGGNSLNLFLVSKSLKKEFGVKISPIELIDLQTIDAIAKRVTNGEEIKAEPEPEQEVVAQKRRFVRRK